MSNGALITGTLIPAANAQLAAIENDVNTLVNDLRALDVIRARLFNAGAGDVADKVLRLARETSLGYQPLTAGIAIPEAPYQVNLPGEAARVERVISTDPTSARITGALLTGPQAVLSWP